MSEAVPFVGLTGGLGSGKSTALAALAELGAAVISSDAVVHELYDGTELRDAVVERFGAEVAPGGAVDRTALAERAFASPEDRAWLEQLVWPMVGARVAAWLERVRAEEPAAAAPRSWRCRCCSRRASRTLYDATIAVVADERLRSERAAGPRPRGRRRARRAPAHPAGEGRAGDVRGSQRRHRGGPASASCRASLPS